MPLLIIGSVVRHLLTAGGGATAAVGISTGSEVETIAGAVVTLIGFLWSLWQKSRVEEK